MPGLLLSKRTVLRSPAETGPIVCVCEYERRLALSKRVAKPEQLHVVYNGVRDVPPGLRARPAGARSRLARCRT